MNRWKKIGDQWAVDCDTGQFPGARVTVTNRAGVTKEVTLGDKLAGYGFCYAVAKKAPAETKQVGDLTGVLDLFAKAKQKLKYPAIVLNVPDANVTLRLSVAGPKAKMPGSITVLSADKNGDGERDWFGRITADGTFQSSNRLNGRTDAVVARLKEFAADPAKVAAEHGRMTASCCFCNKALGGKDPNSPSGKRSLAVGYGQTCAGHYGLPW